MTALEQFETRDKEIVRLLEIHQKISGTGRGYKTNVKVLHKSAFVLITAFWEGFCEDLAEEGLVHLVEHLPSPTKLPKHLRKRIAKELMDEKDETAAWKLAEGGWRSVMRTRMDDLTEERNRRLNTPKTEQIRTLFAESIGLPNVDRHWVWSGMSSVRAAERLDEYVTLRGAIAHRGDVTDQELRKKQVLKYQQHVKGLARTTYQAVAEHVELSTGTPLAQ